MTDTTHCYEGAVFAVNATKEVILSGLSTFIYNFVSPELLLIVILFVSRSHQQSPNPPPLRPRPNRPTLLPEHLHPRRPPLRRLQPPRPRPPPQRLASQLQCHLRRRQPQPNALQRGLSGVGKRKEGPVRVGEYGGDWVAEVGGG